MRAATADVWDTVLRVASWRHVSADVRRATRSAMNLNFTQAEASLEQWTSAHGAPRRLLAPPAPEMNVTLGQDDVDWLQAGTDAELDILPPRALMRELQAAFARVGPPGDPGYGGVQSGRLGWVCLADLPPRRKANKAATDGFG